MCQNVFGTSWDSLDPSQALWSYFETWNSFYQFLKSENIYSKQVQNPYVWNLKSWKNLANSNEYARSKIFVCRSYNTWWQNTKCAQVLETGGFWVLWSSDQVWAHLNKISGVGELFKIFHLLRPFLQFANVPLGNILKWIKKNKKTLKS